MHPRELLTCWPDPNLRRGSLRVLPRTDGAWIVVDESRPFGRMTVSEHRALAGARDALFAVDVVVTARAP